MFCPKCGGSLKENAPFCGKCGASVQRNDAPGTGVAAEQTPTPRPAWRPLVTGGILFVALCAVAAWWLFVRPAAPPPSARQQASQPSLGEEPSQSFLGQELDRQTAGKASPRPFRQESPRPVAPLSVPPRVPAAQAELQVPSLGLPQSEAGTGSEKATNDQREMVERSVKLLEEQMNTPGLTSVTKAQLQDQIDKLRALLNKGTLEGKGSGFLGNWTGYYGPTVGGVLEVQPSYWYVITRNGDRFKVKWRNKHGDQGTWIANYANGKLVDVRGPDAMTGTALTLEALADGTLREVDEGEIRLKRDR